MDKYKINKNRIISGKDRRTSLIIKNLPREISKYEMFYLLKLYTNNIDFFYLEKSLDENNKTNNAFINLTNTKALLTLFEGLSNLRDIYKFYNGHNFSDILIFYSHNQGLESLRRRFEEEKKENIAIITQNL